jgi:meckelin
MVGFTNVFLFFTHVLIGANQQYLATPQPDEHDVSPGEVNMVLRFFIDCSFILAFGFGQIIWKWAIQDRFFTEPATDEFMDLCTIAKVSV